MNMTMNELQGLSKQIEQRVTGRIETEQFPVKKLSAGWYEFAVQSLNFASSSSLGADPLSWGKLIKITRGDKLTLHEFAALSNNIQAITPAQFSIPLAEYANLIAENDKYVKIWNQLVQQINKEENEKLNEEMKMKTAAMPRPKYEA